MITRLAAQLKTFGQLLLGFLLLIGKGIGFGLTRLFGSFSWQPPNWLLQLARQRKRWKAWLSANPKQGVLLGLAIVLLAAGGALGSWWYQHLPKPVLTHYQVKPPDATRYDEQGHVQPQPLQIVFDDSVAPVGKLQKTLQEGVGLSPQLAGDWLWEDDKTLVFHPNADWSIDADYKVTLSENKLLAKTIELDEYAFHFRSPPFTAVIKESRFYQDPTLPTQKMLVATVHFSHPVDSENFADQVLLSFGDGLGFLNANEPPVTISYDKSKLNAYLHSAPLTIPKENTVLKLSLRKGIHSSLGGNGTADIISRDITVPGLYRLNFDTIGMTLIDNERYEPEQVLLINASAPVNTDTLKNKVQVWLLPAFPPNSSDEQRRSPYHWWNGAVTGDILTRSEPLDIVAQATENDYETTQSFKFKAPVGRYLFIKIDQGVQAFGGYQARQPTLATLQVRPYPKAIKLLSEGSLLPLSGERKLAFMSRGLDGVKIDIARLLPNQLHHLVDQNSGGFSRPNLDDHTLNTLVEHFEERRPVAADEFGKPRYDSIDFGQYLLEKADNHRGVFMVKLQGYDSANPNAYSPVTPDTRFVLVTDLGIIAKHSVGGGQDVFVQAISTGQPVAGARVDVVGLNGQAVFSQSTDAAGRVNFPQLNELKNEKQALMVVVSHANDLSFLPINRDDRQLNLSRFDIGGIDNAGSPNQLSAFVFTDRGLYRPGETAHIGFIARTADWRGQLDGLPLEAEIIDPRGMPVFKKRLNLAADGFASIDYTSQESSATGEYHAGLYLLRHNRRDQQIGSVDFKVRDFEPDRMKVQLTLAAQAVNGWLKPESVQVGINAMQLFGSPAAGRRVEAELRLSPAAPVFARYPDFKFRNQFKPIEAFTEKLTATTTDANGSAELKPNLQRFAAATYQLYVAGKVFEAAGGRSVAAEATALVSSAPYLIGVKTDGALNFIPRKATHSSRWLAIDPDLNPLAVAQLTLQVIERRYISVLVKQSDNTYKYASRKKDVIRDSKPYALAAAGADIALDTAEPGDFALVLTDAAGNELNRIEYSVAGQANISRSLERNAELQLTLDKREYAPGDTIAVNIRAPYTGSGLITIERDRVYQHAWFKTDTTSSVQNITLPKDFEGNGYVSVQFVRDPNSDEIFMSPLSYGVAPFAVNLDSRREPVNFSADKLIKPGQTLDIGISTPAPGRAVVFAIDEGILQVARYKTPDPLGFFFQKRALQVNTTQILDMILPAFQKLINAAAPGGDGEDDMAGRHLNPFKKKHQPPVAWWSGLIDVGPQLQTLHYEVPDSFNGKLHLFAVVVNANRIGVYEGAAEVRGDLILSPNIPMTVTPGDEFKVSVGVFNNAQVADTTVSTQVAVTLPSTDRLKVLSAEKLTLPIAAQQEGVAEFTVQAGDKLGPADLRIVAAVGDKQSRRLEAVSIRPPGPFSTQLTLGRFGGDAKTLELNRQLYLQHRKVHAGIALSPLVWSQGLSDYLHDYGYSCTEQLVSKAIPALVFGRNNGEADANMALEQASQILRARQNDDGGFGLWAATLQIEPLTSAYAVHFLIEAKERGIAMPSDMLANANRWLEQQAANGSEGLSGIRSRAYMIYLLTRQGIVTSGLLASLQQELDGRYREQWRQDLTAAYIGASYQLLQQDALAEKIIKAVPWSNRLKIAEEYSYYDPLVHDAQLLYLLAKHFRAELDGIPDEVVDKMGEAISANRYNSLSAAYLMLGLDAYAVASGDDTAQLAIAEIGADRQEQPLALTGSHIKTTEVPARAAGLKFSKAAHAQAFYLLSENGFDRKSLSAVNQGLEIDREFTALDGKPLTRVNLGEEFLVKLSFRSTERDNASQIAIVDLLPGGIEPVLNAKPEPEQPADAESSDSDADTGAVWQAPLGETGASAWRPDYADIRDDRVVLYGNVGRTVGTFTYRVRAANEGRYAVPAPFAEGMYDRRLQARGMAGRLEVVKP